MGIGLGQLWRDKTFLAGLAIRLVLIAAAAPLTQTQWFVPFLQATLRNGAAPWSGFMAAGGDPAAFPYGAPYIAAFLPGVGLGEAHDGDVGARLGLSASIVACDVALTAMLLRISGAEIAPRLLRLYWLSPLVLYVGYWHGQLDVFPAALVVASLLFIIHRLYLAGGLVYGVAVAAKLSMILPAPFIALFFVGRAKLRGRALTFILPSAIVAAALFLPLTMSPSFRAMVLETPEAAKVFSFALPIGSGLRLYILPVACVMLLYGAWRIRRLDAEMLWTFTGLVFMAFLLLTPASPGWAMWTLPFVALHVASSTPIALALYVAFSTTFLALHLLISSGAVLFGALDLSAPLAQRLSPDGRAASVLFTLAVTVGMGLAVQMLRDRVLDTRFRAASRRPLVIGVAGDSGSGKDTLVESLIGMFGPGAVAHLSGDDYHAWDRHKPMWRALTHLNPKANNLDAFSRDVMALAAGRPAWAPHYDHVSGRIGQPRRVAPAELVAASGLHALFSSALARVYDVRIYLDMDEELRRFLKIRRDVHKRGHPEAKALESLDRREDDAARFVRPQAATADVILRLEPRHRSSLKDYSRKLFDPPLRLIVTAPRGEQFGELTRVLTALCGIQAIEWPLATGETEVFLEGEPTAEDVATAARRLAPGLREFLAADPIWEPGLKGIIQLVVLDQLDRACRRRRLAK